MAEEGPTRSDKTQPDAAKPAGAPRPPSSEALRAARQHQQTGKFKEAERIYRQVLSAEPENPAALRGLGVLAHHAKNRDAAVGLLKKAVALDPNNPDAHNDLGGVLGEKGDTAGAVAAFRRALALKPDYAEVMGNLGVALQRMGKDDEALEVHRKAAELRPGSAPLQTQLGVTLAKQEKHEEAAAAFRRALAVKPDHAEAHGRLGNVLRSQGKLIEATACLRSAIRLRPNYPEAHANLGLVYLEQNRVMEAIAAFESALRLKPDYKEAHWNHGLALLLAGDLARGWAEYEWRRPLKDDPARRRNAPQPLWDGSDLGGQTILLHTEQGFGDTIQFCRYASLAADKGGKVILQCRPELKRLMKSVRGVVAVAGPGDPLPPFEVHAPLMTLPSLLGTTLETIPAEAQYLSADAKLVKEWELQMGPVPFPRNGKAAGKELRVGLVWGGNPKPNPRRSCPLSAFAPLARAPGVTFYSLQKGDPAQQAPPPGLNLIDLTVGLNDFADTAALIANLDLVITIDTGVSHLAGAVGKETWVMLPFVPDWRWLLDREDSPWYPTIRLFRQDASCTWGPVVERIARDLAGKLGATLSVDNVPVQITPGELLDRIAALEARAGRTKKADEQEKIRAELSSLAPARDRLVAPANDLNSLADELKEANSAEQRMQQGLRSCERSKDFGEKFVKLARAALRAADRRSALRRQVDELFAAGAGK